MTTLEGVGHSSWRGRAPLVIAGTIPLAILLILPWRDVMLPAIPGFSPMWLSLLIGCDLLTVLLLFSQYRTGGSPRLLALSWAYLWSAGAAIQIAVGVPGIFSMDPTFAADINSLQWLWVSRHVVPPVLIAVALAPWPARMERRFAAPDGRDVRATISWIFVALADAPLLPRSSRRRPSSCRASSPPPATGWTASGSPRSSSSTRSPWRWPSGA